MIRYVILLGALAGSLTAATAHHSVSGVFDPENRVHIQGVISKVDWINPHTFFYLDVTNEDGSVTTWQLESLPTAMLRKGGLTSEMIRDGGSVVEVEAIVARDGTRNFGWVIQIDYEDGRVYKLANE